MSRRNMTISIKQHASRLIAKLEQHMTGSEPSPDGSCCRLAHCRHEFAAGNYEQAAREAKKLLTEFKEEHSS